jgi:hypothetical protein
VTFHGTFVTTLKDFLARAIASGWLLTTFNRRIKLGYSTRTVDRLNANDFTRFAEP